MKSPYQLLQEAGFAQYTAMIRIRYNRDNTSLGAEKIAEMVRAIPGATRVSTVSLDKEHGIAIFNAKIISQKPAKEAYVALKNNALQRYAGLITGVDIGVNTIETKGDFILKEGKSNLALLREQTEQLLLEVSIEELHRQWVESEKISEEVFQKIVQVSNNQSNYATWLCKKVGSNLINVEDLDLWGEVFPFFDRYKQRFQKKDINQVKTTDDIRDFLSDFNQVRDAVEAKKSSGMTQKVKDETDQCLLGNLKTSDGESWKVYKTVPGQWNLERKIGSGTSWCTVASDHYFKYYMGPAGGNDKAYYIFINQKDPKEKYQIHIGSDQCKNKDDSEVDYSEEWVQEFYKYLKQVDNREPSRKAERGAGEIEQRRATAASLDQMPSVLKLQPSEEVPGGTLYELNRNMLSGWRAEENGISSDCIANVAKLFKDLGIENNMRAVSLSSTLEKLLNVEYRVGKIRILKFGNGKFDILAGVNSSWSNQRSLYSYWDGNRVTYPEGDQELPLANEHNIAAYKAAAKATGLPIVGTVLVRCDTSLPGIESYRYKSEKGRKAYRIPIEDLKSGKGFKAVCDIGVQYISNIYVVERRAGQEDYDQDLYVFLGPEANIEGNWHKAVVTADGNAMAGFPTNSSAISLDAALYIFEFLGIDIDNASEYKDGVLTIWKDFGGRDAIIKSIKDSAQDVNVEGTNLSDYSIVDFNTPLSDGHTISSHRIQGVIKKNDPTHVLVFNNEDISQWNLDEGCFHTTKLVTQRDFYNTKIKVQDLVKLCQHFQVNLPNALDKAYGRLRGAAATPNILAILRHVNSEGQLTDLHIPLFQYASGWRAGRVYTVDGRGMYCTWEQIRSAMRESSPEYYQRIQDTIDRYADCTVDAFLYFNRDNPRRTWNGVVRIINSNNKVVWYARRYGDAMTNWTLRPIEPECWTDARSFENNYGAPTPPPQRQPRQPRQPRQAANAQAAAPTGPVNMDIEGLREYQIQSEHADQCFSTGTEHAQELLQTAGFTGIADAVGEGTGRRALVYQARAHRGGSVSWVAVVWGGGNTFVSSLPGNSNVQTAQADSAVWRRLTRQLDNSTATFQQLHDICQEFHIPQTTAIEGWLIYRGQRNA